MLLITGKIYYAKKINEWRNITLAKNHKYENRNCNIQTIATNQKEKLNMEVILC